MKNGNQQRSTNYSGKKTKGRDFKSHDSGSENKRPSKSFTPRSDSSSYLPSSSSKSTGRKRNFTSGSEDSETTFKKKLSRSSFDRKEDSKRSNSSKDKGSKAGSYQTKERGSYSASYSKTDSSRSNRKFENDNTSKTTKGRFSRVAVSFEAILLRTAGKQGNSTEVFGNDNYTLETLWKNNALQEFWNKSKIEGTLEILTPSPRSRGYRTSSKLRLWHDYYTGTYSLRFSDGSGVVADSVVQSKLDVPEHNAIYKTVMAKLQTPPYKLVLEVLNYVIIRGSYEEFTVILNVAELDSQVVRKLKLLGEHIQETHKQVRSCFIFLDPSRSQYYMDQEPLEHGGSKLKKLYGYDTMRIPVANDVFMVPATGFTQINLSLVPAFTAKVKQLAKCQPTTRLIDLYCGYGLFAFSLRETAGEIIGMELDGASIRQAQAMAKLIASSTPKPKDEKSIQIHTPLENSTPTKTHRAMMRFLAGSISPTFLEQSLPRPATDEVIILDPPRGAIDREIIDTLAKRKPRRILHIFCGVEEISTMLKMWHAHGYYAVSSHPFDMFPGTAHIEVIVVLEKRKL
jgi:tRNA/tmRNA/rRNA uracil-C5-methylase (TrmA/RlmC/RlmD family)